MFFSDSARRIDSNIKFAQSFALTMQQNTLKEITWLNKLQYNTIQ